MKNKIISSFPEPGLFPKKSDFLIHLLQLLADGCCHSGEKLGELLGLSRAGIWKIMHDLKGMGIEIISLPGRGYVIPGGFDFLHEKKIISFLSEQTRVFFPTFFLFLSLDSTNRYLLDKVKEGASKGTVCLAEYQYAGRGRRGRSWNSPFGKNIYLSLLWQFDESPLKLSGLSLAVGIAVFRTLSSLNITGLTLKWPNDIYGNEKKLAGILTEIYIDSSSVCHVIIGIGINLQLSENQRLQIEQPCTDLASLSQIKVDRNQLVASLLSELVQVLALYQTSGLSSFLSEWEKHDYLYNKPVQLMSGTQEIFYGIAQGIDPDGGLRVNIAGNIEVFRSGEVSVRGIEK